MITPAQVKLASLTIHLMEHTETGHPADLAAARSLAADPDVLELLGTLSSQALLPETRQPLTSWPTWEGSPR